MDAQTTLQMLMDLHRGLSSTDISLDEQLSLVANASLAMLEADHASIRVLDDTGVELVAGARAGTGIDHKPVTFGRGLGVAGWIVDHGVPALIHDVTRDERFVEVSGQGFKIRSMVGVPLFASGSVIGCLIATSDRPAAFSPMSEQLATLLAALAAAPIERARLEAIALRDSTTRAFGARYLFPRLSSDIRNARRRGESLALIVLEIDELHMLRDTWGRSFTDAILGVAVDRMLRVVRPGDAVIRRDGGEIMIVLPQTEPGDANALAERVLAALAEEVTELGPGLEDMELEATLAVVPWNGSETAVKLERRADEALRVAKRHGTGSIHLADGSLRKP